MFTDDQITAAAEAISTTLPQDSEPAQDWLHAAAKASLEAVYAKGFPQREFGADHKYTGMELVDEEGRPWMDETDFRAEYADEGDIYTPMVRHVSPWVPLEPEGGSAD